MLCKIAQVFARGSRPIVLFAFIPFSGIEESSCILTCTHSSSLTRATASANHHLVELSYLAIKLLCMQIHT